MLLLSFRCIFIVLRSLLQYLLVLILGFFLDIMVSVVFFFFSSRRRHTRYIGDWSSDVCSSDLAQRDPRAVPVPVDARDSPSLVREMKRWDCVINSSWYDLNVPIMEAAIEAGIHYCDLGGLYHQTRSEERRVGKECRLRGSRDA